LFAGAPVRVLVRYPLAIACLWALLAPTPPAAADEGHLESQVRKLRPSVPGLELSVVDKDKLLQLRNQTRRTVVVKGYDGEPYLRFKPDGTVERNLRAPATYLNVDRFGGQKLPSIADPRAPPRWKPVANGGVFTWFDHRIHLTLKRPPPELRNLKRTKKIFDWRVPLSVDGRPASAVGALVWKPASSSSGGFPTWLAVAIGALVVLALAALLVLRRRRPRPLGESQEQKPAREAW
jgi:MYXO-CTERM domain-containing protein